MHKILCTSKVTKCKKAKWLSEELVKDRDAWHAAVHEVIGLDRTEQLNNNKSNQGLYYVKSAGVNCHSLLEGIFSTQGSNPGLLHCKQILYHLSHQGSPLTILSPPKGLTFFLTMPCRTNTTPTTPCHKNVLFITGD